MVSGGVLGGVTKVKDVCDDDSEAPPGIELLRAGENDCLVPTPMATGEPVLGDPLRGEPTSKIFSIVKTKGSILVDSRVYSLLSFCFSMIS